MNITITQKEYSAIFFACEQIESAIEAGAEEVYVIEAKSILKCLYAIVKKYKKAQDKAWHLSECRKQIRQFDKDKTLSAKDVDKMARLLMAEQKEQYDLEQNH